MTEKPISFIKYFIIMVGTLFLSGYAQAAEEPISGVLPVDTMALSTVPVVQLDPLDGPHIVVNVAARRLYFYDHKQLVRSYPVAVGSSAYRTPLGDRELSQIIWNPWWLPPDSGWAKGASATPPGPHNPLGPVKMDLGNAILFHGTNKPKSIGMAASHGCMRMNSEDAREFAQFIQTNYTLQNDPALFEQYAKNKGRSFYVKLENPILVSIVYEIAEVRDGKLNVFKDVYYKFSRNLKQKIIEEKLSQSGVEVAKIDSEALYAVIAKSKTDIELDIEAIKSGTAFITPGEAKDGRQIASVN